MPARVFTQPVLKILVVAAIAIGFIFYVTWGARLPKPDEKNRVVHATGGYSIIKPPGWELRESRTGNGKYHDWLELSPPAVRSTKQPRIFIGRFRNEPDLEAALKRDARIGMEFQGRPATTAAGETKRRDHYWRAIIPRRGEWFELVLWMPVQEWVPDSEWWPYLNSLHIEDVAPATLPTTLSIPPTIDPSGNTEPGGD
jgi:hypothetical protein